MLVVVVLVGQYRYYHFIILYDAADFSDIFTRNLLLDGNTYQPMTLQYGLLSYHHVIQTRSRYKSHQRSPDASALPHAEKLIVVAQTWNGHADLKLFCESFQNARSVKNRATLDNLLPHLHEVPLECQLLLTITITLVIVWHTHTCRDHL